MPIVFEAPQFFLLIPLLAALGWHFRSLRLWKPLRAAICVLLTFVLAHPRILRKQQGMDLWVLTDRSLSAREIVDRGFDEWRSLLERSRPSHRDRLHFVDFAAEVSASPSGETSIYPGSRALTRTALAIQDVLARTSKQRHSRLLIFTDGYSTEPLGGIAEKLSAMRIPLDFRLLRADSLEDYRISAFEAPGRVQSGEPFILNIDVQGSPSGEIPVEVYRSGNKVVETKAKIEGGRANLRLADRVVSPGAHRYEVRLRPSKDAYEGNNKHETWIEVVAGPRVLLITNYEDDPIITTLRAQGFAVQIVKEPLTLEPGMLAGARSVIINNVPAYEIPQPFLAALDFFVREQGGGFLMAGGKYSFGSGGYHESAVDALLPVSMELKSEHRKLAVAMAIVMDRSGSMAMTVASGDTKMSLADEGAARAVELLGALDAVTVYAVDSSAHEIAPLLNVGKHRAELLSRIRRIESMGGGIYVYTGLKAAWESLRKSDLGQRHIILFSDAADSEEPGDYKNLIAAMRKEGATISVIGLGSRTDSDAAFLEDIAKRGEGRMFFTNVPDDLPNIFAQETVTVARSAFLDDPVTTQPTGNWFELAPKDLPWLPKVDGYNLSYLREGDRAALITGDDYHAPLVAFGRRGIGRSAAVSFPLGGEFSTELRNWNQAGDFLQTLNRWLMGDEIPSGIGMRHQIIGTELRVDLFFEGQEWRDAFARQAPSLVLSHGEENPATRELTWERLSPGHYSVKTELREGELTRGAIKAGGAALPFGPVVVGSSVEWAFDQDRIRELRQTSAISGGRELVDLKDAWLRPEGNELGSIQAWLLVPLLLLILLEALATRTGWKLPYFVRQPRHREAASNQPRQWLKPKPSGPQPLPERKNNPQPNTAVRTEPPPPPENRKSRYERAKKKR